MIFLLDHNSSCYGFPNNLQPAAVFEQNNDVPTPESVMEIDGQNVQVGTIPNISLNSHHYLLIPFRWWNNISEHNGKPKTSVPPR